MKVIIADDEKWVRAAISRIIPFQDLGLKLVAEASNGIEALDLCKKYKPEILITDIMMPGLSGLELIEELKKTHSEIKIIIISGYSDFEYAQQAIKLGVNDYILKPVDEKEIVRVLCNLKNLIINERKEEEEKKRLKTEYKKALPIVHENFLNQLLQPNSMTVEVIKNTLLKYNVNFTNPCYTIAVITPNNALKPDEYDSRFKTILRRVIKRYLGGVVFAKTGAEHELVVILNHKPESIPTKPEDFSLPMTSVNINLRPFIRAFDLCDRFYEKLYGSTFSVGISLSSQYLKALPELYHQAKEALLMKYWKPEEKYYFYRQNLFEDNGKLKITNEMLDELALNIRLSNCEPVFSYIDSVIENSSINCKVRPDEIREFFWTIIQSLSIRLNLQLSFIGYESILTNIHPYEKIKNTSTADELRKCAKELIQHLSKHYLEKNPINNVNLIETARKIIDQSYYRDINLEQVARYVHLSPAYFSELFKKETGMSFVDYKTNLRIENAKRLLLTTNFTVQEISSKVGFSDPKYFSKLFRKITGKTIYEFRKENGVER